MRVTGNTFSANLLHQLQDLALRQHRYQSQAATGQRVAAPEDDPLALRRILDLQAESGSLRQYERNLARMQELGTANYHALRQLKALLTRATEIATRADGLRSPEEMKIFGREVTELLKQAVQIVNAQNQGDYLFGGTRTHQPPFAAVIGPEGTVTAVHYQGNAETPSMELLPSVTATPHLPGANHSGNGPHGLVADSRTGADLFAHLVALQDRLNAGDSAAIQGGVRQGLNADEEHLLLQLGSHGAFQSRLETTLAVVKSRTDSLRQQISREGDADLAETLIRLKETQTAYEAALQSSARVLGMNLLDFLR
jgi:flagellar hook-associated protein 3 FlgL